jgi:hypothetical protein
MTGPENEERRPGGRAAVPVNDNRDETVSPSVSDPLRPLGEATIELGGGDQLVIMAYLRRAVRR